ncbi:MAG: hypothetical protein GVY31_00640 [Alphaproteobacteria bacterium]|jgi:hypothetical protein|nr:hypothetical protein [Alphaproteobacteria bacterium]
MQQQFQDFIEPAGKAGSIAGLSAETTILTLDGELPVDQLTLGDKIITRDTGTAVLCDLRVRDVTVAAITIKAGSLGHTRPDKTMVLGPDTRVHIRDWRAKALFGTEVATVKARRLLDGEFVIEAKPRKTRMFELVFDTCHIVYADGLEVASASD